MSENLDAAFAYAYRGWPIFPTGTDKKPLTKNGVLDATTDIDQIKKWWTDNPQANIALDVGGAGMMVLDLDPGHDLDELDKAIGGLPDTSLVSETPRGGKHLFFDLATNEKIAPSSSKVSPHVDVRSFHSYVLLPPGCTDQGQYQWLNEGNPAFRTDEMLRVCNSAKAKHEDRDTWLIEADLPENIETAIHWLKYEAKPAIENEGGDAMAFKAAAMMKSYGISQGMALDLMMDHWNHRCIPNWDFEELEGKVDNAYRYNNSPPGNVTQAYKRAHAVALFQSSLGTRDGKPVVTSEHLKSATPSFYYLGMLEDIPEPTWVIEGVLPEGGYTLIYGKRSTKKSFLALDMGLSLATGKSYHGRDVKRGRVVYFAGEGFRGYRRRIKAWFEARNFKLEDYAEDFALVQFTPKWDKPQGREQGRNELSAIAKDGPISLVVVDTARRAMSGDENAPTHVGAFLDGVSDICREFGCGHLIVHHAGKDESKGARGGGPFEDDADAVFHVTKGTGGAVKFKCTKQKDDEADWSMLFRADRISLGNEPNGKPITSLSLSIESESKAEDDGNDTSSSARDKNAEHDDIAIQILDDLEEPSVKRGALATAVMGKIDPEMRDSYPTAFGKALRAYRMHLARLSQQHILWPYIGEKNDKGEALTFINPNQNVRRAANPRRRRTVNCTSPSQEKYG